MTFELNSLCQQIGIREQLPIPQESGGGWRKGETKPWFLLVQFSGCKNLCLLFRKLLLQNKCEKKPERTQLLHGQLEYGY